MPKVSCKISWSSVIQMSGLICFSPNILINGFINNYWSIKMQNPDSLLIFPKHFIALLIFDKFFIMKLCPFQVLMWYVHVFRISSAVCF